jgi:hypothetical protein
LFGRTEALQSDKMNGSDTRLAGFWLNGKKGTRMGWITKLIVIGVVGYGSYYAYKANRAGYFELPDLPQGAYILSFKNGMRSIVLDAKVAETHLANAPAFLRLLSLANPNRQYIGLPFQVAPWFEDLWSTCIEPTEDDRAYFEATMPNETQNELIGARFDAVCYLDVDGGERLARGLIYSVPKQ